MFETIHVITKKEVVYKYPCIKTAIRVNGKTVTFFRVFGLNRTREDAIKLCESWLEKMKVANKEVAND